MFELNEQTNKKTLAFPPVVAKMVRHGLTKAQTTHIKSDVKELGFYWHK